MPRALATPAPAWLATSLLFLCCGQGDPGPATPSPAPSSPLASPGPWHYTPALAAGTPPDVAAAPVFELADGRTGLATIAVAAAREGAPPRLELWRFSQNNRRERLERVGDATLLLALDGSGTREELGAIYRAIAQPGNEYVRPRGLAAEPDNFFTELARLARLVRDPAAAAADRTAALASLTFALDDHLLFERALLPDLLAALADGDGSVTAREPLGERRLKLTLGPHGHRFTLARTGDKWVLTEAALTAHSGSSAPAADPSPTAP